MFDAAGVFWVTGARRGRMGLALVMTACVLLSLVGVVSARAAAPASPTFSKLGTAVGAEPQTVAIGDLNGDGHPDLVVANEESNSVSVLLGGGNGKFTPASGSPVTVGSNPVSVAIGDLNGDGHPDLVVANAGGNSVSVLLGGGSGAFTPASGSPISVGSSPVSVAVGDVNGDGIPDLAVANNGSNSVSVLLGGGSGAFTPASGSPITVGSSPLGIAVGDLNGDGIPDLAVANNASDSVSVLLGAGSGAFTPASGSPITVGSEPFSVAIGDLDGDGVPDLAVANNASDSVSVLLGAGSGTFTPASGSPVTVGTNPVSVAIGDLNGDGRPDLAVANFGSGVSVLLGGGGGTFTPASGSPITVGSEPVSVAIGDLNGDGIPDVAVSNEGSQSVSVLLNTSRPAAAASPSSVMFTPAQVGSEGGPQTVTVSNSGAAPLSVSSVSLGTGGDAANFEVASDGCSGQVVVAGASCAIGVRFDPQASGPASAQLRVVSNAAGGSVLVGLSGAAFPFPLSGLSFATTSDPVFAAGLNSNGQLGVGGTVSLSTPAQAGSGAYVAVAAGGSGSLGLRGDGTVWAWGANTFGQLGNGSTVDSHASIQVPTPSGMVAVAAGLDHSLAVRSDGTVWAWGSNQFGQLGDGTTTSRSLPVQVRGLSNVVAVSAGGFHSLALRSDGTVWAWGFNAQGQLGNGSTSASPTAVQVKGLSGVVAIAAGDRHSLALASDGTVWSWGSDADGQLGIGSTINKSSPVHVPSLSGVVAVAAGASHSLALLSGGTVKAWGDNANGQLGTGNTTQADSPVSVSTLTGVTQIAGGFAHSLAIDSSGRVWAWGANNDGQLGTGNTAQKTVATQMTSLGNGGQGLAQGPEANHALVIGQAYAGVSTSILTFGSEPVGTPSSSQTVTIANDGVVALSVGQATIIGSDGDEFTISGDGCSNTTLASLSSCTIGVRFDPLVAGTPAATLRIPSNAADSPNLITLDPPPFVGPGSPAASVSASSATAAAATPPSVKPKARAAALVCARPRTARGKLTISCRLTSVLSRGAHRYVVRLAHRAHTAFTSRRRVLAIVLDLPHGLRRGRYALTIATSKPTTTTTHTLRLPTVRKPAAKQALR
jgi:alpha-tubulin suppressor-like RCC1 family protein